MAFNWTSLVVGEEYAHVATYGIVSAGLIGAGIYARSQVVRAGDSALVPSKTITTRAVFEVLTEFVMGQVDAIIGKHGRKYVPLFATIFLFVLANNLMGFVPGMSTATENLNTTLAMGLFVFVAYNYLGLRENGMGYLQHFLGPVLWLAPFMLMIELLSHLIRPFSLGLRLANVMKADHLVAGIFLDLLPFLVPIPLFLLGLLVSVIQAVVFMLLSMVYVAMATAHDH